MEKEILGCAWFNDHPKDENSPYWIAEEFCALRGGTCDCEKDQKAEYKSLDIEWRGRPLCMGHVVTDEMLKSSPLFPQRRR